MYSENFISKKLRAFAQKNDWLISGEYIYGEESGFLFTGMDSKKEKTFITPVPGITPDQESELFELLKKNENTMKLSAYEITDDFLSIRIKDSISLKPEDIEFILALLTGALQEINVVAVNRCQECKELNTSTTNFIYDLYCYLHDECAKIYTDEISSSQTNSNSPENVLSDEITDDINSDEEGQSDSTNQAVTGESVLNLKDDVSVAKKVIYTIAGALLGSIPWLILPYVLDLANDLLEKITRAPIAANVLQSLLICLCAYFIPYFAITGYRLSSGKFSAKGRWITGIVSVSVVILIQFAYLAVLIVKEPGVSLNFANYMTNIVKFNFYINMLLGALIGIVFTLISVLPYFDSNKPSAKKSASADQSKSKPEPVDSKSEQESDDDTGEQDA